MRRSTVVTRLLITAALLLTPGFAAGATFVVNSQLDAVDVTPGDAVCATAGAVCTLRAAVQEANALAGVHVITLPAGTYTLTIRGQGEFLGATGDLNIASGKNITINGAGSATTIIDANGIDRAFQSFGGILTLNDLTVQNGAPVTTVNAPGGGGISMGNDGNFPGQLTLTRVVVKACTSSSGSGGGGIIVFGLAASPSTLTVTDSTITQNVSGGSGGALNLSSGTTATVTRTTVSSNLGGVSPSMARP